VAATEHQLPLQLLYGTGMRLMEFHHPAGTDSILAMHPTRWVWLISDYPAGTSGPGEWRPCAGTPVLKNVRFWVNLALKHGLHPNRAGGWPVGRIKVGRERSETTAAGQNPKNRQF
jgi:hypothetical protein